ncbi:MAG: glycogen/starch synthase, partial [Actinomycetota bacterium]
MHNAAYQGPVAPVDGQLIGVDGAEHHTLLGRGIEYADVVNTVSPTYLREILTPELGMGLDAVLR